VKEKDFVSLNYSLLRNHFCKDNLIIEKRERIFKKFLEGKKTHEREKTFKIRLSLLDGEILLQRKRENSFVISGNSCI